MDGFLLAAQEQNERQGEEQESFQGVPVLVARAATAVVVMFPQAT